VIQADTSIIYLLYAIKIKWCEYVSSWDLNFDELIILQENNEQNLDIAYQYPLHSFACYMLYNATCYIYAANVDHLLWIK